MAVGASSRQVAGRRLARVLRLLARDERGMALVMSLAIVIALTISTAGLVELVRAQEHAFGRDRQEERAFNAGEAGVNAAISSLSQLASYSYAQNATVSSSGSTSLGGASYTWTATKTSAAGSATDYWTVTGTGTYGSVSRKVVVQTVANNSSSYVPASGAWGYGIFVANPSGCTDVGGTVSLTLSVFVLGDLCLNGSATNSILEPNASGAQVVDVYVQGSLYIGNNPSIGTSARRIRSATVVNGCFLKNVAKVCNAGNPIGKASNVYASTYSTSPLSITKPTADAVATYAAGDWANPVCSTGSFTFDTNTTRDTSVGNFTFMTGSKYNCTVYKAGAPHTAGNEEGTISWDPSTKALAVSGTLYVDGNLNLAGGDNGAYTGFASIWVNGTVQTNGNSAWCGPPSTLSGSNCSGTWDGAVGAISVTAVNAGNASPGWKMNGNTELDVAAYVNGLFQESGTAFVTGPVITDSASLSGTPKHTDVTNPPPNTPGASTTNTSSTWGHVVKGTWRQCPVSVTC
jgi:Tfp pilus assembly protein PilX